MGSEIQSRLRALASEHGIDFKPVDRAIRFCGYITEAFEVRDFAAYYDFCDDQGGLNIVFALRGIGLTVTFFDPTGDAACTFHDLEVTEEDVLKHNLFSPSASDVISILGYLSGYECKVWISKRPLPHELLQKLGVLSVTDTTKDGHRK